jgi:surfeit locus 1 family protein
LLSLLAVGLFAALGVWQLERLKWKDGVLAEIAVRQAAPAQPLGEVLRQAGEKEFRRVSTACAPAPPGPPIFRYAVRQGAIAWRPVALCALTSGPWDSIVLDRGVATALAGRPAPAPLALASPHAVVGILRKPGRRPLIDSDALIRSGPVVTARVIDASALARIGALLGARRPAPWLLVAESESPAPVGVIPAALPEAIPNNHFGYALTWFGLAAAVGAMAVAYFWRRMQR